MRKPIRTIYAPHGPSSPRREIHGIEGRFERLHKFEKRGIPVDLSRWDPLALVFISVATVSELLVGVHRANSEERRLRRSQFVEAIIAGVSILDFTLGVARLHSELHAELTKRGERIGAHDLMIAATAIHHNLPLLAQNIEEFRRVPGLQVVAFNEPT